MKERTPSKGNEKIAILYSFLCIGMPWTMESTRKKWYKWVEFAIFHIGIALAILTSFMISFGSEDFIQLEPVSSILKIIFSLTLFIVIIRLLRRVFSRVNRLISHPDDFFSIAMMVIWFFISTLYVFNETNRVFLGLFLAITTFLIAYVPFSKMSHYIMWPFSRYYFGKHFGHRGVYPKVKS
jgi:nitrate reductase gamma subunit